MSARREFTVKGNWPTLDTAPQFHFSPDDNFNKDTVKFKSRMFSVMFIFVNLRLTSANRIAVAKLRKTKICSVGGEMELTEGNRLCQSIQFQRANIRSCIVTKTPPCLCELIHAEHSNRNFPASCKRSNLKFS